MQWLIKIMNPAIENGSNMAPLSYTIVNFQYNFDIKIDIQTIENVSYNKI